VSEDTKQPEEPAEVEGHLARGAEERYAYGPDKASNAAEGMHPDDVPAPEVEGHLFRGAEPLAPEDEGIRPEDGPDPANRIR
jgi:hypothetical protein